jgi:polar amino acid transport system permease protein
MRLSHYFLADAETGTEAPAGRLIGVVVGFSLLSAVMVGAFGQSLYAWNWAVIVTYWPKLLQGWWHTVFMAAGALVLSLIFGTGLAWARSHRFLPLRYGARIYLELVRGTPLLVQLLVSYYFITHAIHLENRYVVGAVTLSLFSAAYISEIIRAGVESVGASQRETARALGLTSAQTYRLVIMPQAIRQMLPPLAGQLLLLVKDSSLLSVLGISEFTQNAQEVNAYTFSTMEGYLVLAGGYLLLTLPLAWAVRNLEARFRYET